MPQPPSAAYGPQAVIRNDQQIFRDDFSLDMSQWVVVSDPSITSNLSGSVLTVNANTNVNATYTATSTAMFTLPFRVQFTALLSQRIANQSFYLEVVNAAQDTMASWLFDGTTTTSAKIVAQHDNFKGQADASVTINGTGSHYIYELDLREDAVDYIERTVDSNGQPTSRASRTRTIPEPAEPYYVRIRVVNGSTAPASNTQFQIEGVLAQDCTRALVDVAGGRGNPQANHALPVNVQQGSLSISNASLVTSNTAGQQDETTAALAASATYTGTTRDFGTSANTRPTRIRMLYRATAASVGSWAHVVIQESSDNTNFYETGRMPMPADGAMHTWEWTTHFRYYKILVINGATAQTALLVSGQQVRGEGSSVDSKVDIAIPVTNTLLAASAVFTSATLDIGSNNSLDKCRLYVATDQACTAVIQGSHDNTNWHNLDPSSGTTAVTATAAGVREFLVGCRYFRAVITNGATAQTRLYSVVSFTSL